ncbi:MAG: FAD-binding oxidoreductase, partial [Eubacteriales bacterium]|nr:FAD-binding oxidoreductase [Eubacteriales bacterium]
MESIWSKTCEMDRRPPLRRDETTDVVVIGAGMAGILTAYLLAKQGHDVVVLEANRIGSGQTRNTTAKVTSQHGCCYETLVRDAGPEQARQYADAHQAAIAAYARIIADEAIDCHWQRLPSFVYGTSRPDRLKREADAAAQLGLPASFTTQTSLPFAVQGAVRFEDQAQFHPLKFLSAVARQLNIYEQTRVTGVEDHALHAQGHTVTARHIVFASHYPFVNVSGYYFMRMHQQRSYLLALEGARPVHGMYIG